MKPTNIFSSYDKYYDQKIKRITPKTGRNTIEKLNNEAIIQANAIVENESQELDEGVEQYQIYKQ